MPCNQLVNSLQVDFHFADDRGSLTQLVHSGFEQVNVLISKAGVMRGGHYHKRSTECFYVVSGSVLVNAEEGDVTEVRVFEAGGFFQIRPNVRHSLSFPEDCVLIAMYDRSIVLADGEKDIYSE